MRADPSGGLGRSTPRLRDPRTGALEELLAGPIQVYARPMDALRAMETDAGIASGAKLETFLYLDRTFGFNLVAHLAGGGGPAGKSRP